MNYLNKTIDKIILIDFFTEEERLSTDNQITQKLDTFLNTNNISVESFSPNSDKEFLSILQGIGQIESNGLIIHFIGHGGNEQEVFGNKNFLIKWEDIRQLLVDINNKTNDSLIVNSTIMCYGHNIFKLIVENQKPFYAAIGSTTSNSLQGLSHNKQLYEKCFKKDIAKYWLDVINKSLPDFDEGRNRYELKFA